MSFDASDLDFALKAPDSNEKYSDGDVVSANVHYFDLAVGAPGRRS